MPIRYPDVLAITRSAEASWSERDTMLYALGLGAGADLLDPEELKLVTEFELHAIPTMATVLTLNASPANLTGFDYRQAVHGEQSIRMHRPLPVSGSARADSRVLSVHDKGPGKGAVMLFETLLSDAASGEPIATLNSSAFARGDGGFGGPNDPVSAPHAVPDRAPDLSFEMPTRRDQALLYRLSGDYNPLHADPELARSVGFEAPILHGLCTYGIAARAVMKAYTPGDPSRILAHQARFSAPVIPGDVLRVDLWRDGDTVSFEVHAPARGAVVIRNGRTLLG
jgi:acyl dehydratase